MVDGRNNCTPHAITGFVLGILSLYPVLIGTVTSFGLFGDNVSVTANGWFLRILYPIDAVLGLATSVLAITGSSMILFCPSPAAKSVNSIGWKMATASAFPMILSAIGVIVSASNGHSVTRIASGGLLEAGTIVAAILTPIIDGVIAATLYMNHRWCIDTYEASPVIGVVADEKTPLGGGGANAGAADGGSVWPPKV